MKSCLTMELFREVPDKSNIDSSLRMGLLGSSKALLTLHTGCQAAGFTGNILASLLVFHATTDMGLNEFIIG